MRTPVALALAAVLAACASTPSGIRPPDMSVAEHEAAAAHWASANAADVKEQEEALRIAEAHRAAAQALRDAGANACKGIAPVDRDSSPFSHRDIERVIPVHKTVTTGKNRTARRLVGATIRLRATPGLTREGFQRIIECHLAWNAVTGSVVPEMPDCPLMLKGSQIVVRSSGAGVEVDVTSEESGASYDIWDRAQRLASSG